MIRHILITGESCLDSMLAINWAAKQPLEIETVTYEEIPDVAEIYGVVRTPTLLKVGKHGLRQKVDGYNKRKWDDIIAQAPASDDIIGGGSVE